MEPILVPKPWGGRRLSGLGKALPVDGSFGESWEIADLPAGDVTSAVLSRTVVADGPALTSSEASATSDDVAADSPDVTVSATVDEGSSGWAIRWSSHIAPAPARS